MISNQTASKPQTAAAGKGNGNGGGKFTGTGAPPPPPGGKGPGTPAPTPSPASKAPVIRSSRARVLHVEPDSPWPRRVALGIAFVLSTGAAASYYGAFDFLKSRPEQKSDLRSPAP